MYRIKHVFVLVLNVDVLVDYKLIRSRNIFPTDLIIVAIQNDVICLQDWLLCVLKSA